MRQVANDISTQSNSLETALGERDSGMEEAPEEHLSKQWQRCCWGESGNGESSNRKSIAHLFHVYRRERRWGSYNFCLYVVLFETLVTCVDRTNPLLTNDPREPLQIMEECDNTYDCILFQYCFFNIEELKQHTHTERHHLHPLLNESNANSLERLHDDDDNERFVLAITTTTKQLAHGPSACRPHRLPRRRWGWHLLIHDFF